MPDTNITFDDGDAYERYMGRWSRAVGEKFLAWLGPPKAQKWLDVGCGTGAFSQLIVTHCAPSALSGVDPSPQQVAHAQKQLPQGQFQVAGALALPFDADTFDIVASALVLHFLPDRAKAFAEMHRIARPGGLVAGYTWNRNPNETFAPYAPMARAVKSLGLPLSLSPLVPEAETEGLNATLKGAGFKDIDLTKIEAARSYRDFDEFWEIQTIPLFPVGKTVAALGEADRARVRETVQKSLPPAKDGSISYSARAIAFKARR